MKKSTQFILALLVFLAVAVWASLAQSPSADSLKNQARLIFLNVGQGDAVLIEKGTDQLLIDGGPDDKVLSELSKVMPLSDRTIETVVLTHPHADHLTGLNQILDRYQVGTVYSTEVLYDSNIYSEFQAKIKAKKINLVVPALGQKLQPFDNATFSFLWPGQKFQNQTLNNLNNSSEVNKFCYLSRCALLTGDLETDAQTEMFGYYAAQAKSQSESSNVFQAEILKLPHHGSTNGTNQNLLDQVKPKYAVISVGAGNQFGHPHAATIDLFQKAQIPIYRTDHDGTVEFDFSDLGVTPK